MLIEMFDGDRPSTPGQRIDNYWLATINGLLGNRNATTTIRRLIDQAFAQSPYL